MNERYIQMNQQISQLLTQNVESLLYQIDHAHYQKFEQMIKYLQNAELTLDQKIQKISDKMEIAEEQFIRTSTVLEMNNKKRLREEQLLRIQRTHLEKQLDVHEERLQEFAISHITPILKMKKKELEKLEQTKEIIEEFNKLNKANSDHDLKSLMPLDAKNFSQSALKIYVFKVLFEDIKDNEPNTSNAKIQINKKYTQLKNKIIQNFKEGYRSQDTKAIKNTLPYCQEYELMDKVSDYYNFQIFQKVHKITQIQKQQSNEMKSLEDGKAKIKSMFFLIENCFKTAFSSKDDDGKENPIQINNIMGTYAESFGRKLVTYVFDKIILDSLQVILKSSMNFGRSDPFNRKKTSSPTSIYLTYLQLFYDECRELIKKVQKIMTDDRIVHLMSTYFESIFDQYLDSYNKKQLNNLKQIYEICTSEIIKQIEEASVAGRTQYAREKERVQQTEKKTFTFAQMFQDLKMDSKKNISTDIKNQQIETNKKIKCLLNVFIGSSLSNLFATTKISLARNNKIARINEIDRNRNQILDVFINNMDEVIKTLISLISELVPSYSDTSPALDPQFFLLIPNINYLLQRIEFMYEEYKRQSLYRTNQTVKEDQKKQALIQSCGRSLKRVVNQAMASIISIEHKILSQGKMQYYNQKNLDQHSKDKDTAHKICQFLERYIKVLNRVNFVLFKNNTLKSLGLLFINELFEYFSKISYNKDSLSKIFFDLSKYKNLVLNLGSEEVENKFNVLKKLIDMYVISNDDKEIEDYIRNENLFVLVETNSLVDNYRKNKKRCEKN